MTDITGAIVIDSGSGYIKAGLAKNDFPTVCTPNVLLETTQGTELEKGRKWFGAEAFKKYKESALPDGERDETLGSQDVMNLKRPMERGQVTDWEAQELIWYNLYQNHLKLDSFNYPVLLSVSPDEHKTFKEKLV